MSDIKQRLWIPVAFSVGATAGIAGAYLLLKNPPMPASPRVNPPSAYIPPQQSDTTTVQTVPVAESSGVVSETSKTPLEASAIAICTEIECTYNPIQQQIDQERLNLNVSFEKTPDKLEMSEVQTMWKKWLPMDELYFQGKYFLPGIDTLGSVWKQGAVKDGKYAGSVVYLMEVQSGDGLGGMTHLYRIMMPKDGSTPRVLGSENGDGFMVDRFISAPNIKISGLEVPVTITLQNGKTVSRADKTTDSWSTSAQYFAWNEYFKDLEPYVKSKEGIQLYQHASFDDVASVYLINPEREVFRYISRPNRTGQKDTNTTLTLIMKDTGEQKVSDYQDFRVGGCGVSIFPNVIDTKQVLAAGGVVEVAKSIQGESFFAPVNPTKHPAVKETYDIWYVPTSEVKPSLEDFLKKNPYPVLFWKDAFGNWIRLVQTDIQPAAECGKPVIYLYPEKTTNVSVRLPSFVNVTVSEPTYPRDGWKATANPDGSLQYADGKTYESLYWEGTGINYQAPKTGWVVKGSEVESFMDRTLAKYGLNQKESQDFKDFWLPIMQKHNLMRVSFLVEDWSKAAPLSVSPRPDTSIRIFMDWQPVSEPISIKAPNIKTPVRKGFTLVEWGGMLYR